MLFIEIVKNILFMVGFCLIFIHIFPPLHLINDPKRKEKEKKLIHLINVDNMSKKQKTKMFLKMLLGMILISIGSIFIR